MPRLPSRQNSSAKVANDEPPQKQWVMIAEEQIFDANKNEDGRISFCKLRHPKSEKAAMYVIPNSGEMVTEVTKFTPDFGSWLIGNSVQKDGGVLFTTPVDPVFLVMPYLITASKSGKFMTLDQIVHDEEFPDCSNLLHCDGLNYLDQVTDMKGTDDFKAFRFNKEKTLAWLRLKTENVVEALRNRDVRVSETSAQSSDFVRSKKDQPEDLDAYFKYACGLVSDYLPLEIATDFKDYLGIKETDMTEKPAEEPPNKRAKLSNNNDITPDEDYSANGKDLKKQNSKNGKQTAAQKKLSKVDKSGMKSISSFFSPKS